MNKVPRKVRKKVILSWKSLENHGQISVRTLCTASARKPDSFKSCNSCTWWRRKVSFHISECSFSCL